MIVVSDTSPLSNLLAIGKLEILPRIYTEIVIPNEVAVELLRMKNRQVEVIQLLGSPWILIKQINNPALFQQLNQILDKGESEAIALAVELTAPLVLIEAKSGAKLRFECHRTGWRVGRSKAKGHTSKR